MSEPFLFYILKLSTVGKGAHFTSLKWTCWSTWCALKAVTFPNLCPLLNLEGKCSGLWALSTDFPVGISFVLPGLVMGWAVLGATLREQSHCQVKPGPTPHPLLRAAFDWGSARSLARADRVHSHLSVTHTRLKLLLVIEEPTFLLSDFSTWPNFCRAAEVFHVQICCHHFALKASLSRLSQQLTHVSQVTVTWIWKHNRWLMPPVPLSTPSTSPGPLLGWCLCCTGCYRA